MDAAVEKRSCRKECSKPSRPAITYMYMYIYDRCNRDYHSREIGRRDRDVAKQTLKCSSREILTYVSLQALSAEKNANGLVERARLFRESYQ